MDKHFHIAELISKKIKAELSSEEETLFQDWLNENKENSELFVKISDNEYLLSKHEIYQLFDKGKTWSTLEHNLFKPKVIRLNTNKFLRYAASIALPIILMTGMAYYFLIFSVQTSLSEIDEYIKPGVQKATLVLSDGAILKLQKEDIQMKIEEGKAEIINQNNALTYNAFDTIVSSQASIYNELITPRGGSYNITLADGTKVWLNAASTLKFPVVFNDSIRQIFLEGEAFFDVAHNGKPFIVNSGNMDIEVLGTSFNIYAYSDETDSKTTLVDGSIKLTTLKTQKILVPNEQAIVSKENFEINIQTVNTTRYTSWVNGKIEFSNESLDVVMKRLARWYDFSYSFKNQEARNFHFSARIENKQTISSILEMLQKTTDVKLKIEENTIIIL